MPAVAFKFASMNFVAVVLLLLLCCCCCCAAVVVAELLRAKARDCNLVTLAFPYRRHSMAICPGLSLSPAQTSPAQPSLFCICCCF